MNNSIELLIFNMIYGCIMLLLGIFFKKTKHSSTVIMFISGDYSDLDPHKVCYIIGKRMFTLGIVLFLIIPFDFWEPSIAFFAILILTILWVIYGSWDFTKNRGNYK